MIHLFSSFRIIPFQRREKQPCQECQHWGSRYLDSSGVMVDAGVGEVGRVCPALGTRVVAVGHGAALGDQGARVAVQVHTRAGVRVPLWIDTFFLLFIYFYYLSKIELWELLFFRENKLNILFFWENYCTDGRCWIELAMLLDQKVERILETEQKCFK